MKQKWYLKTWVICILFAFWFVYGIPLIIGIILLILKRKEDNLIISQLDSLMADNQRYAEMLTPEMKNAIDLKKQIENFNRRKHP